MDRRDPRLPPLLVDLIESGVWYTPGSDVDPRIPVQVVREWDRFAKGIHLINVPPTVQQDAEASPEFYKEFGALSEIDPAACIVIADFGIGSDSPIVLDLSKTPPPVLRLRFPDRDESERTTTWETIAPDASHHLSQERNITPSALGR